MPETHRLFPNDCRRIDKRCQVLGCCWFNTHTNTIDCHVVRTTKQLLLSPTYIYIHDDDYENRVGKIKISNNLWNKHTTWNICYIIMVWVCIIHAVGVIFTNSLRVINCVITKKKIKIKIFFICHNIDPARIMFFFVFICLNKNEKQGKMTLKGKSRVFCFGFWIKIPNMHNWYINKKKQQQQQYGYMLPYPHLYWGQIVFNFVLYLFMLSYCCSNFCCFRLFLLNLPEWISIVTISWLSSNIQQQQQ